MHILVINNMAAGLGDGLIYDFIRDLAQDGDDITMRVTDGTTRIESFLHDAQDFDCIVVSGGDSSVVSTCYALRDTGIPILAFPGGTANLLATNLKIPEEPRALADIVRKGKTLRCDLAEMKTQNSEGKVRINGFAIIAGCGFDAAIMHDAVGLKHRFGAAAYPLAALNNFRPTVSHFKLDLDGEIVETDGIALLAINFAQIFPDISITHDNNAQDGLLEVAVLKTKNALGLLPALLGAVLDYDGNFAGRSDALQLFKAKHVKVEADPELYIQYDGDVIPDTVTPLEAWVLPGATTLIAP